MLESLKISPQQPSSPSLHAPPVYRSFLAGGPDLWRLSRRGAVSIVVLGVLTAAAPLVWGHFSRPAVAVSSACAATLASLITAELAAGWLGRRVGVMCGCLYLLSGRVLLDTGTPSDDWLAALAAAAVGVIVVGNLDGRRLLASRQWMAVGFYCLVEVIVCFISPRAAAGVVLTCAAYVVVGQNVRGLRFFADRCGLVVLAVFTAIATAAWLMGGTIVSAAWPWAEWTDGNAFAPDGWQGVTGEVYQLLAVDIPVELLPWGPLALVAIVVGLRQGHQASPLGKLLFVWLVVPLLLAAAGLLGRSEAAALVFPPLVILCGWGLERIVLTCRHAIARKNVA